MSIVLLQSVVIAKALRCVSTQRNSVTDPYSNAIIAYALTLAKHPDRPEFLRRLKSQAIVKGNYDRLAFIAVWVQVP